MNKKLVIAIVFVVILAAALFIGANIFSDAHEEIVFYDETAVEVVGVESVAPSTWFLPKGEYTVIAHDGSTMTVIVANGSWQYTQ